MQSPTREEIMKLWMHNEVADVQEKNDAVTDAQKKNGASCKCAMQLQMYIKENVKEQVAEGSCKAKACSYRGTNGRCVN